MASRQGGDDEANRPTLAQAWAMLAQRYDLTVDERGPDSVAVDGNVRGRRVRVEIAGVMPSGARQAAKSFFGRSNKKSREREQWRSMAAISCANTKGPTGTIRSFTDVKNPSWDPRNVDPAHGKVLASEPASLVSLVPASVRDRLFSLHGDITLRITADAVVLDDEQNALVGAGYGAGSVLHHYVGSPTPLPERVLVGPAWWFDVLCDLAAALDGLRAP